jgi:transcriptional regulator with XRE-family HTH domain
MTLTFEQKWKIWNFIIEGKTYREIAKIMSISFSTIRKYAKQDKFSLINAKIKFICELLNIDYESFNGKHRKVVIESIKENLSNLALEFDKI